MAENEVIFNCEDLFVLDTQRIGLLKEAARNNPRKTMRICLHQDTDDLLHQMVIVHSQGNYVRPHRHPAKTESFHIIEGSLILCIFDESGLLTEQILLGERNGILVARIAKNIYHTVVPVSDLVVFHEITNGPFTGAGDSEFPAWAAEADDTEGIQEFFKMIRRPELLLDSGNVNGGEIYG